jgi:hypothetical protein
MGGGLSPHDFHYTSGLLQRETSKRIVVIMPARCGSTLSQQAAGCCARRQHDSPRVCHRYRRHVQVFGASMAGSG